MASIHHAECLEDGLKSDLPNGIKDVLYCCINSLMYKHASENTCVWRSLKSENGGIEKRGYSFIYCTIKAF